MTILNTIFKSLNKGARNASKVSKEAQNPTKVAKEATSEVKDAAKPGEVVSPLPPPTEAPVPPVSSTGSSLSGKILPWVWDTANTGAWGYAGGSIGANLTDDRNIWGYSPNEAGFLAGLTAIALANGGKTVKGVNTLIRSPSARNALVKTVSNIKNKGGVFPAVGAVAVNSSRNSEKEEKSTSSSFNGGTKFNRR